MSYRVQRLSAATARMQYLLSIIILSCWHENMLSAAFGCIRLGFWPIKAIENSPLMSVVPLTYSENGCSSASIHVWQEIKLKEDVKTSYVQSYECKKATNFLPRKLMLHHFDWCHCRFSNPERRSFLSSTIFVRIKL